MSAAAGFFRTIILLGTIQGFLISGLLFFTGKRGQSNRLLSVIILLMAMACLNLYMLDEQWVNAYPILNLLSYILPLVVVMPIGPLIWLYTRSLLDPDFVVTKKYRVHFWPVIVDLVPYLTAIIYFVGAMLRLIKVNNAAWGGFIDTYDVYSDIPRWISITLYCWISARYIIAMKASGKLKGADLKWVREFLLTFGAFQFLWLIFLVPYVIPRYTNLLIDKVGWWPIYVPMSILIYWLGIRGYLATGIQASLPGLPGKKNNGAATSLPMAVVEQAMSLLQKAMEVDKLYLDPELNVAALSRHTGIAAKQISAVLNQHMHKSFSEFVNTYRVEAFKEKARQPQMEHLTITGIAFECGFNSQATFQRSFKQVTGLSPSGFLSQVKEAG